MQHHVTTKPLPFFYVGKKLSADRITRFQKQKHNLLSQALGKPDTRSIWYSKEHFVKLLEEIEFAGGDGIRIHFGMYEEGHQFAGQLCLLFTSTREKMVGNAVTHSNVILEHEANYAERASLEREVILFPGDGSVEDIKDFNLGLPCPPRCDDDFYE
ncbi:hypothetical protein [Chitinophaga tropicalis]|uniref:Uncharacterized protein n=1 Tax=Chitinophaga tropicalis TaxID=2683588 RepID=A0A7K1U9J9_9BACT|nr:hypothetical protein [Chitinophaga tropicalis]MVT11044.1 hypothetical protein [Chitinophaga tropicalis]